MNLEEFIEQILSGIIVGTSLKFIEHLFDEKRLSDFNGCISEMSNEDLKYLTELAKIELANKFTTEEIKVEMIHR